VGGSRTFSDRAAVADKISQLRRNVVVLTSRTHGASAAVRDAVQDQRLQMQVWTARMEKFRTKDAAYFARDEEMIRSADHVIEFWDGRSIGTSHELDYARKLGKPVELVLEEGQHVGRHGPRDWRGTDPNGGRAA
jgi:nucleoside 2-deoxyribosyltransferase